MNTTRPTLLGITDEVTTCELCGKNPLKRTYVLDIDGEIVYYGSTCGSRALREGYAGAVNVPTLDEALYLQKVIDLLHERGTQAAKDWAQVRGFGIHIVQVGPDHLRKWRLHGFANPIFVYQAGGKRYVRALHAHGL